MKNGRRFLGTGFMLLFPLMVWAQMEPMAKDMKEADAFRSEYLQQLKVVQNKLVSLAEAIPAEKYSWRPMEGVRSVSEVLAHVAQDNYYLPAMAGVKAPDDLDRNMEKTLTEKEKVIHALKESFEHLRTAMMSIEGGSFNKPAKFFGEETTVLGVMFESMSHVHEHLGQMIAYARMNQIVPPWTAAAQAKREAKEKKKE